MKKGGKLEGWKVEKLGDVCNIVNGSTPLRSNKSFWENGDISWFTIDDIRSQGRKISETKQKVTQTALEESSLRMLPINSVLLCCTASIGEYAITEIPLATNQQFNGLVVKNQKLLSPYFLFHYCSTLKDKLLNLSGKTTIDFIPISRLRELEVPIPPLPEQQRIVSVLDEAFASIAQAKSNAERNLVNARELFEKYKQSVFDNLGKGWELKTVGDVSEHSLGKMLDKQKNRGKNQKYLRNANVRWFEFDLSDVTEMRFLEEEAEKYTAIKGDLLICEGGYPGRAAIWQEDYPIFFQKAIHRVRFHKPEYTKWFLYFLHSSSNNGNLKKYLTGTGIQHFTGQALDRFVFPVPPVSEIRAIVGRLEALSAETGRLEEIYQQKVESLEELKKSVLGKAFAGEL